MLLKIILIKIFQIFKVNLKKNITPGISFFGYTFFVNSKTPKKPYYAAEALKLILGLQPKNVLDVGSGSGSHAIEFIKVGSKVDCIDFGTSIYAKKSDENLNVIHEDFNNYHTNKTYDLIWASHVLEHQQNVGLFLKKIIQLCTEGGYVCITVPTPHRHLWGGHLTLWSPGLLAYNICLCGVNIRDAKFIKGDDEFSIFFKKVSANLPNELTFDNGDLIKLSSLMPKNFYENSDPWNVLYVNQDLKDLM